MAKLKGDRSAGHQWGLRVGTEIVASTMIGLGAGFLLDRWLGTRPVFLLLFFSFGVVAGYLNLYHVMGLDRKTHESPDRGEQK
ncbi:MAG TPA: AtpZ/AtpI family protein [Mariprofundaceae bacterium]|nr:AtpZ/AtpI family protein [Mariprofundaceae bacterium]